MKHSINVIDSEEPLRRAMFDIRSAKTSVPVVFEISECELHELAREGSPWSISGQKDSGPLAG